MLWNLANRGVEVIPVTGRPAGWCEMIARLWPVRGVIGENGAFYFSMGSSGGSSARPSVKPSVKSKASLNESPKRPLPMTRHFMLDESRRLENEKRLEAIKSQVLAQVPGAAVASDQFTRLFDLAIDFCEDVPPLEPSDVKKIVDIFNTHGATAKISSIHVNGWFGDYDKRSMCEIFFRNELGKELSDSQDRVAFVGDSPNDEPLFGFFKNSFGVRNIEPFLNELKTPPRFLLEKPGGQGFCQLAQKILELKSLPRT